MRAINIKCLSNVEKGFGFPEKPVLTQASQTWFGALFNGRFERFVSDHKTIQPSKYSNGRFDFENVQTT